MRFIITALIFLATCVVGLSQKHTYMKLDSFFNILKENDRFYGSIAVTQGGNLIYKNAIGYADLKRKVNNEINTKFRIGSISKTFTATLVMKAVELGKLKLDDNISAYFPEIQNANKITIRHLLNHKSGISNFTDRSYFSWYKTPITQAALLDTIVNKGVDFAPNTDYAYSNSNYVLLTFILEKVLERSYSQILEDHIIRPLGLNNTYYGGKINTANAEAKSYRMEEEWTEEPEGDMSIPLGAGGIVSTPTDLCLFARALFRGELISEESLKQMKPVGEDSYGFALYGTTHHNMDGWGHGGNIDAFASNLIYFEEEDISIAISCNGSNFGINDVELAAISEILGKPYDFPSFNYLELSTEELDPYLGTYATEELPMDFIIAKEDNVLFLTITGQSPIVLNAEGDHKFSIMKYGVKVEFVPEEKTMHFTQQGMAFLLKLKDPTNTEETVKVSVENNVDFELYTGVYTSDQLPIDLDISSKDDGLVAQGTGQPSFNLVSLGDHKFSNTEIGLTITFIPEENKMKFKQGGSEYEMVLKE